MVASSPILFLVVPRTFNAWKIAVARRESWPLRARRSKCGMPKKPHDGAKGSRRASITYSLPDPAARLRDCSRNTERKSCLDPFITAPRHTTVRQATTKRTLPGLPIFAHGTRPAQTKPRATTVRRRTVGSRRDFSARSAAGRVKIRRDSRFVDGNSIMQLRNSRSRHDRNHRRRGHAAIDRMTARNQINSEIASPSGRIRVGRPALLVKAVSREIPKYS
jgi:hypothetical protein